MFKFDDKLCNECGGFTIFQPKKMKEYEVDFEGRRMQCGCSRQSWMQ